MEERDEEHHRRHQGVLDLIEGLARNTGRNGGGATCALTQVEKERTLTLPTPWNVIPEVTDAVAKQDLTKLLSAMGGLPEAETEQAR